MKFELYKDDGCYSNAIENRFGPNGVKAPGVDWRGSMQGAAVG